MPCNNTGKAYQGKPIHTQQGIVTLADYRFITFGLCEGSADLIGIAPGGRFLAIEVKTDKGRATIEQQRFINAVLTAGGIAGIVRSPQEAVSLITQPRG